MDPAQAAALPPLDRQASEW